MDGVVVMLDHHYSQFLGEKVVREYRNQYVLIVRNVTKENAGTCLLLRKNHNVTIVEKT